MRSLVAVVLFAAIPNAFANVVDVTASGFLMRAEVAVEAAPDKAFTTFVSEIGNWWNPQHSYSGDAKNFSIDAKPLGCFCEKIPNGGGGIAHMTVVYVQPNNTIRMVGGLGPLQSTGVSGSLTMKFTPASSGSKIEMTYSVGGYMQGGYEKVAPLVDSVMSEQLRRLKTYIETGKPTAS